MLIQILLSSNSAQEFMYFLGIYARVEFTMDVTWKHSFVLQATYILKAFVLDWVYTIHSTFHINLITILYTMADPSDHWILQFPHPSQIFMCNWNTYYSLNSRWLSWWVGYYSPLKSPLAIIYTPLLYIAHLNYSNVIMTFEYLTVKLIAH